MRQRLCRGSGGGASTIPWVAMTQGMLDAGTKQTGGADTLKSAAVAAGVLTVTANAIAATADGIRETSGIAIPILDVVPTFDPDEHDLLIWLDEPENSATTMAVALAICNAPGAAADGVGLLTTGGQWRGQTVSASQAPLTGGAGTALVGRFVFNTTTDEVAVSVWRQTAGGLALQNSLMDGVALSNLAAVFIYVQAASYSGAQSENATASATVYFAIVPKITAP